MDSNCYTTGLIDYQSVLKEFKKLNVDKNETEDYIRDISRYESCYHFDRDFVEKLTTKDCNFSSDIASLIANKASDLNASLTIIFNTEECSIEVDCLTVEDENKFWRLMNSHFIGMSVDLLVSTRYSRKEPLN